MCTRAVYLGPDGRVVTGRSLDWTVDIGTNLWALPRGIDRTGETGAGTVSWTAKYGSVIATAYDACTTDGLNEAGLTANLLWLAESEYPQQRTAQQVSIAVWAQYVLDNFATVADAVAALRAQPLAVVTVPVPGQDRLATVHLALSDRTGDSAVIEYVGGEQVIHHGRDYQVMTNSPTFDRQLAIAEYWRQIGGTTMLPGTNRAADRFVRASFYINALPQTDDALTAIAAVLSVIRNASVPYGISVGDEPNISSTWWRTATDSKDLLYVFESALSPNTFWVDLLQLDLGEDAPVRKLELGTAQRTVHAGEVSGEFVPAKPFAFLSAA